MGQVRAEDDPAWLVGRAVELLMPGVERDGSGVDPMREVLPKRSLSMQTPPTAEHV